MQDERFIVVPHKYSAELNASPFWQFKFRAVEETYVTSRNPADGGGGGALPPHITHRGHAVNHDLYYNMTLLKL
jgi:hypothetical protein